MVGPNQRVRDYVLGLHAPLHSLDPKDRRGRKAFGFVRNPWDRQWSMYCFAVRKQARSFNFDAQSMGFKRWLLEGRDWLPVDERMRFRKTHDVPPVQRRPQTWYLDGCDFVGRFEQLQADFEAACAFCGVSPAFKRLEVVNATPHGPYQDAYDDEARLAVASWFAPDIERWGYVF